MYPLGKPEEDRSFAEWRAESGRSTEIWQCDSCEAQFDLMPDGRRRLMTKAKGVEYASLYPEEWARVAVGLDPGAGNAFCNGCEADFFLDGKTLTLLDAREDIHGFGEHHLGRLIDLEDVRWLAVGKESPHPGLSCPHCDTEFDKDGDFFRLIRSHNPALARFDGEPFTFEDWHRIAQRLPTAGDEQAFVEGIQDAIARAYRQGEIGFDSENEVLWRGPATRLEDGAEATLTITRSEIAFGGLLRKSRRPMDALTGAGASQDQLALTFRGVAKQDEYVLEPIELSVSLESGEKSAVINAEDLAARLTH